MYSIPLLSLSLSGYIYLNTMTQTTRFFFVAQFLIWKKPPSSDKNIIKKSCLHPDARVPAPIYRICLQTKNPQFPRNLCPYGHDFSHRLTYGRAVGAFVGA